MRKQTEINYEMKLLSSLDKVFQDETPVYRPECMKLSALWGETVSYQAAYTGDFFMRERLEVQVVSEIADAVRVRTVEQVPVGRATNGIVDDNYLKTTSGLYPDLLRDLPEDRKVIVPGKTLNEISKILSGELEDMVDIYLSSNHILFPQFAEGEIVFPHPRL